MCVSLCVALLLFKTLFVLLLGFLLVASLWSHYSLGSATSLTITAVSGSAPQGARPSQLYLSDVVVQPTEGQLPNVKGAAAIMFGSCASWERYEDAFSLIFNICRVQISPRKDS